MSRGASIHTPHTLARLFETLRPALEASWDAETSYKGLGQAGSPYGQCYPTSIAVQHYYQPTEIITGVVWTGTSQERHFWNRLYIDGTWHDLDLTWDQFPAGSIIQSKEVFDQSTIVDSAATRHRCAVLLKRVGNFLNRTPTPSSARATRFPGV